MWKIIINWSEVWSLVVPIVLWLLNRRQPDYMRPVITYLFVGLALNLLSDSMGWLSTKYYDPNRVAWWDSNTPVYNLHSLVRFFLFSLFFMKLGMMRKKWVLAVQLLFVAGVAAINLFTKETFWNLNSISGIQFSWEAFVLLILCLGYYLKLLQTNTSQFASLKSFWMVTGIAVYCVVNFFVFLFYNPLLQTDITMAIRIWDVHNLAFIVTCCLIALSFAKRQDMANTGSFNADTQSP